MEWKKSDYEGLYKQHKEFGLYPEGGLQGGDMYAIYKYKYVCYL